MMVFNKKLKAENATLKEANERITETNERITEINTELFYEVNKAKEKEQKHAQFLQVLNKDMLRLRESFKFMGEYFVTKIFGASVLPHVDIQFGMSPKSFVLLVSPRFDYSFPKMLFQERMSDAGWLTSKIVIQKQSVSTDALFINMFVENINKCVVNTESKNVNVSGKMIVVNGATLEDLNVISKVFETTKLQYNDFIRTLTAPKPAEKPQGKRN